MSRLGLAVISMEIRKQIIVIIVILKINNRKITNIELWLRALPGIWLFIFARGHTSAAEPMRDDCLHMCVLEKERKRERERERERWESIYLPLSLSHTSVPLNVRDPIKTRKFHCFYSRRLLNVVVALFSLSVSFSALISVQQILVHNYWAIKVCSTSS